MAAPGLSDVCEKGGLVADLIVQQPVMSHREGIASHQGWHSDLAGAVMQDSHPDPLHAADKLGRVQTSLLALVPALSAEIDLPALPPLDQTLRQALASVSIDSLYYLAGGESGGLQPLYQRMADRQAAVTREVSALLASSGILPLIFKGAELRERLFGGRAISTSTDIDVLVREAELETARQVLKAAGFVHAEYDPNTGMLLELSAERIKAHEGTHRELYPLCRLVPFPLDPSERALASSADLIPLFVHDGQGLFLDVIDLHRRILRDVSVEPLFARAKPSVHPGAVTLSTTDHLWTSCLRFYLESSVAYADPKHRDLAYVAAIVHRGEIDWQLLVDVVTGADLRPAFFYTLRLLNQLGIGTVPPWVVDMVHPRRGSHHLDFGCRATRALGLIEGASTALQSLSR